MHTKQQTSFTLVAKVFKDGEHNGDALAISLFSKIKKNFQYDAALSRPKHEFESRTGHQKVTQMSGFFVF